MGLVLLLIVGIVVPQTLPAHGAGGQGQICIVDPAVASGSTSTNACPSGSSAFKGPLQAEIVGGNRSQLRVNINVNNTAAFQGFDIILTTDSSKLQPFDVDLTSSVVSSPVVNNLCVAGSALTGSCGSQAQSLGDLELGVGGAATTAPTFGNLFTAIYNIVGDVSTGSITIGFEVGCSSAASFPPDCVTLPAVGGGGAIQLQGVVTATFATAASGAQPFWTLSPGTASVQIPAGGSSPSAVSGKIFASNGFTCGGAACLGVVPKIVVPSYNPPTPPLTFSISPSPPFCETNNCGTGAQTFTVSVSTTSSTPLGTYTVYIEGSTQSTPGTGNLYLATSIILTVKVVDFSVSASPTSLSVLQGTANTQAWTTITVTSIAGAQGTVTLSCSAGCITGGAPAGSFNVTSVSLPAGGSAHANFTIASGTASGTFTLTVRGTLAGVPRITTPKITATVLASTDYYLAASPTSAGALVGNPSGSTIKVITGGASHGSVALSVASISPSTGLTCNSLSPSSLALPAGGTSSLSCTATTSGTYTITVNGVNATTTHTTTVTLIEQDFLLQTDQTTVTTLVGSTQRVSVTATGQSGFAGNITLASSYSAAGLSCGFEVQKPPSPRPDTGYIVIPPTFGSDNMDCTGSTGGSYVVTITAIFGVLQHTKTVTFNIQDFALTAKPTSVTATLNSPGISSINASSIQGYGAPNGVIVTLAVQSPTGLSCSLNPVNIHLNANYSISQLSCTSSTVQFTNAKVNVTGTSGSLPQRTVTVLYTVVVGHTTITSVSCVPATVTVGISTTCTATVTDTNASPTNPTGTVSFANGGASGAFTPTSCSLTASGSTQATCTTAYSPGAVGTGTQSISASYGGDSTHSASSTTTPFSLTVTKTSPTLTTTLSATSVTAGGTASDSASFGPGTAYQPTGTVSYLLFSASYCTGSSGTVSVVTVTGGSIPSSRSVTFNNTGTYGFEASYSGDANNSPVTSSCEALTVTSVTLHTTTVAVSCSPGSVNVNSQSTCTATVTDTNSSPTTPTGTVSFTADAGTFSGSGTCTLTAGSTTGVAACSVAYNAGSQAGTPTITGSYNGDSTHKTVSGAFSMTVTLPSQVSNIFGLDPTTFYAILGGIIALVVIVGAALGLRRRKGSTLKSSAKR